MRRTKAPATTAAGSAAKKEDATLFERISSSTEALLNALTAVLKLAIVASLVFWGIAHRDYWQRWLWGISGGEVLGFKFTRAEVDQLAAKLVAEIRKNNQDILNSDVTKSAFLRAFRVVPAIVDSRILWVDDKPKGNEFLIYLLDQLRIGVVVAKTSEEAFEAMKISPFDIVITNVWRPSDPENGKLKLDRCRVHYFDYPDPKTERLFLTDPQASDETKALALLRFNAEQNLHSPAGFGLAEQIISKPGSKKTRPDIVFFSDDTARVARTMCGRAITNRADVLLNLIVSILSERHSDQLAQQPWERDEKKSTANSSSEH